jgi:hypothetical protein
MLKVPCIRWHPLLRHKFLLRFSTRKILVIVGKYLGRAPRVFIFWGRWVNIREAFMTLFKALLHWHVEFGFKHLMITSIFYL